MGSHSALNPLTWRKTFHCLHPYSAQNIVPPLHFSNRQSHQSRYLAQAVRARADKLKGSFSPTGTLPIVPTRCKWLMDRTWEANEAAHSRMSHIHTHVYVFVIYRVGTCKPLLMYTYMYRSMYSHTHCHHAFSDTHILGQSTSLKLCLLLYLHACSYHDNNNILVYYYNYCAW